MNNADVGQNKFFSDLVNAGNDLASADNDLTSEEDAEKESVCDCAEYQNLKLHLNWFKEVNLQPRQI